MLVPARRGLARADRGSERTLPEVRPREVPEFAGALAMGQLPVVPATPPVPLPGPTASTLFQRWLVRTLVAVGAVVVLVDLARELPALLAAPLVLGLGLGVLWLAGKDMGRVGDRNVQELRHGYTTVVLVFGSFWMPGERRRWKGAHDRAPWDYRGVWVLDGTGRRVLRAPDLSVEPPGFFPSPHRPGSWELWTGVVWSGHLRPPPGDRGASGSAGR